MNAKITQGKRQLWQWDTGVQLMLFDIGTANEVHFATPDGVIRRDIVNNMCNIPDVVLQRAGTMVCYVFNREPYEGDTRHEFHFDVLPRPKPADYIDPPGEADYLDQLYDRLKDEIVGPPGPQGERGEPGPAGPQGLPGTSVSITSISQSTEDDGYSVVTFSDGKTLRVKNGSKGSPGEGGSGGGGGVMTVACTPTEDGTSFTADKSFEEIGDALLRGQAVQAYVQGLNAVAQMFMFSDNMVVFSAVASLMGDNAAVTLMMMKAGTNTMSATSLGGTCIVNISTGDGVNGTADMTGPELFEAASMGQPVYANFNGGMYAPAQLIDSTYAVFRIEIPGGVIMATIDEQGAVAIEPSEGGSAGGGGGNVVAVTLTYDGNTIKPSHTSNEIYNLVTAGNTVLLQYGGATCTAKLIGESECVFEHMGYSTAGDKMTFGDYMTITIAEDVVTFKDHMSQSQYPNPHPLVINGVSYDGSKRVEMNVTAASSDAVVLTDTVTGKQYRLCVTNGKLTMDETASARASSGEVLFTDTETRKKYRLRVINAELTMEEVVES